MIPGDEVGKRQIIRLEHEKEYSSPSVYQLGNLHIITRKPGHVFVIGPRKARVQYVTWATWFRITERWTASRIVDKYPVVRTRDD